MDSCLEQTALTRNDFAGIGSPAAARLSQGADHHGSSELPPAGGSPSFEEESPAVVEIGARDGAQKTGGAGIWRAATPAPGDGSEDTGPGPFASAAGTVKTGRFRVRT